MRHIKRMLSSLLITAMLCLPLLFVIPVNAASDSPLQLSSDTIYKVSSPYSEPLNTFEAVVNFPSNMNASTRGGVILGNYGQGNPNVSFEVYGHGQPRLYITDSSGNVTNLVFNNINIFNGKDTHVAIVRDAAQQKAYCYIDGELAQTLDCAYTADIAAARPMVLGGDLRAGNEQYFKGSIISAALYSTARSASDIKTDYQNNFEASADMIACYNTADRDSTGLIPDHSGNGYHAKLQKTWFSDKDPVTDYAYSFAVVGDTQIVAKNYPEEFHKIYDYIVDNINEKNIKFVLGLGDITDADTDAEWSLATDNIFKLDGKVPYSVARGNHDSVNQFNKHFPHSKYSETLGGSYDGTMLNTWQKFTVGEIKYLVLTLDYGAATPVLKWASEIIESHSDYNVIITTHAYLFRDGTTLDQGDVCPPVTSGGYNNGDHMWELLVKNHENIVLVLSGHDPCDSIVMAQDKGENGNTVTQLLIDPQGVDASQGATGMVAMLYFSEDGKNVTVEYYSTVKEQYFMTENQFSFTLDTAGDPVIKNDDKDDATSAPVKKPSEKTTESAKDETEVKESVTEQQSDVETIGCTSTFGISAVALYTTLGVSLVTLKKRKKAHKQRF